jgi:O-antigen/teichoic acid export membrane protein
MAEVISIRVFLFFVAFFVLQPVLVLLLPRANRAHGLVLLAVSTLIAFMAGALILGDPLGDTLVAWFVITAIIAVLWFLRWWGGDYVRSHPRPPVRSQAELDPEEVDARRKE